MIRLKRIAVVVTLVMLFALSSVYAAVDFTVNISKTELNNTGDIIETEIVIDASEPIRGVQGTIAYNRDVLEVKSIEKGGVVFDGVVGDVENKTAGKVNFSTVYAEPELLNGQICKVVFSLKDGVTLKKSEVRLKNLKIADESSEGLAHEDVYQYFDIKLSGEPSETPSTPHHTSSGGYGVKNTPSPSVAPTATLEPKPTPDVQPKSEFDDTISHWAREDIEFLYNKGIVKGVTANRFEPDRSITRAEFAKLASLLLDLKTAAQNVFSDVSDDSWYKQYVMLAYTAGLVTGDAGEFRPNDSMTRAELAVIADRMCSYAGIENAVEPTETFEDDKEIPSWAKDRVYNAVAHGIIQGNQNKFDPNGITTRAQSAAVIRRIYALINKAN